MVREGVFKIAEVDEDGSVHIRLHSLQEFMTVILLISCVMTIGTVLNPDCSSVTQVTTLQTGFPS